MSSSAYGPFDILKDLVQGNLEFVQQHIQLERANICFTCEKRQAIIGTSIGRCTQCGCFLDAKTRLTHSSCPLNKWKR